MSRSDERQAATDTARQDCAAAVGAVAGLIFSSLDEIASDLRDVFDRPGGTGSRPSTRQVQALRPQLLEHLARHGRLFDGTGVVIAPGRLSDRERYLEWWRGPGPRRLSLDLDPSSEAFYDYTHMDWFAVPRDTDQRVAHGPWVDHRGADRYVITFARPVHDGHGLFVGIAGADVPLTGVEEAVMPALRAAPTPLALVNRHGRVMASTSPTVAPGVLIRAISHDHATPVAELGAGWRVVDL